MDLHVTSAPQTGVGHSKVAYKDKGERESSECAELWVVRLQTERWTKGRIYTNLKVVAKRPARGSKTRKEQNCIKKKNLSVGKRGIDGDWNENGM